MKYLVLVNTIGVMEKFIKDNGKIIKWMESIIKMNIYINRGETVWTDNKRYIGEYYEDKKHGDGIFEWGNGKRYEGKWENGK